MSVIQLLVMKPERRPEFTAIGEAAATEEVPYSPEESDLENHTGFLPVSIGDRETGFEYYFEPIENGQLPDEVIQHGSYQMISRTGSDMSEMFAALPFFRTAARLSGAAYVYPDEGIVVPPEQVDEYLSAQIKQVRKFIK